MFSARMSSDSPEVLEMLKLMIVLSKNCNGPMSAQGVGKIMHGLNGMRSDKPEVLELLQLLSGLLKATVCSSCGKYHVWIEWYEK